MEQDNITPRVLVIKKGVQYRARKHFLSGDFKNPYGNAKELRDTNLIKAGMADLYDREIEQLKHERVCPACGQTTCADIDF